MLHKKTIFPLLNRRLYGLSWFLVNYRLNRLDELIFSEPQITLIINQLLILWITISFADAADFRRFFSTEDLSSPFEISKDFQIDFQ